MQTGKLIGGHHTCPIVPSWFLHISCTLLYLLFSIINCIQNSTENKNDRIILIHYYTPAVTPHSMLHRGLCDWFCPFVCLSAIKKMSEKNFLILYYKWLVAKVYTILILFLHFFNFDIPTCFFIFYKKFFLCLYKKAIYIQSFTLFCINQPFPKFQGYISSAC